MQELNKEMLQTFFKVASEDVRLSTTHLGLYFVLYNLWVAQGCKKSVNITRKKVMKHAKISIATYHKCIKELQEWDYIQYIPSYNPATGSLLYFCYQ